MKEEASTVISIPLSFVNAFALRGSCHVVVMPAILAVRKYKRN